MKSWPGVMMMNFDKSLMSGSTTLIILSILENQDMYGYQIIKELKRKSEDTFLLNEGTLYPILHLLEKQGYVVSYMSEGDKGRPRKYYKITDSGKRQLKEKKEEWINFSLSLNKVIGANGYE